MSHLLHRDFGRISFGKIDPTVIFSWSDLLVYQPPLTESKAVVFAKKVRIPAHILTAVEWPLQCDYLCAWCCYKIEKQPIPYVKRINFRPEQSEYELRIGAVFCSWSCMYAHALEVRSKNIPAYSHFYRL